jgi:hypothetical protein
MLNKEFEGKLNNIDRTYAEKIIHINTKFRDNYFKTSAANFSYTFPIPIKNTISMRLQSVDIPNSWYNISKYFGNNRFKIKVRKRWIIGDKSSYRLSNDILDKQTEEKIFEIIVPDGTWTPFQLTEYLNNKYFFQQEGKKNDLCYLKVSIGETVSITRFDMIQTTPNDYKYDLIFCSDDKTRSLTSELGWTLGFRMAKYKNIQSTILSEGLYDTGLNRLIFISIRDFNNSSTESDLIFVDDTYIEKNVLGKIYTNKGKFRVTISDCDGKSNLKIRNFHGAVNIRKLHITIYDEYGNIINLNNMDYSLALKFKIKYEKWD